MSKRYTPEEKAAALAYLRANRWNIAITSVQLGIPQRTLTWWRQLLRLQEKLLPLPPSQQQQSSTAFPKSGDDTETFQYLREQLKQRALEIATSFSEDLRFASPYQRALMLAQFLETMTKLEAYADAGEHEDDLPSLKMYPAPHWRDKPQNTDETAEEAEEKAFAKFQRALHTNAPTPPPLPKWEETSPTAPPEPAPEG